MAFARLAAIAAVSIVLTGCINSATLIRLKPDGSGTVEQTTLMNTATLKGVLGGLEAQGAKPAGPVFNEADLKKQAERMGGVTFVSAEPVKGANGFEGMKALYSFTDINKVRVDQDPNMSGTTSGGSFAATEATTKNPLVFTLAKSGDNSLLTVTFPDQVKGAPAAEPETPQGGPDMANPQMLAMMKTMFDGFKVGIDLEVAGSIVKTNADYVSGSRVTLLEMDLGQLLQDEAKLKQLQSKVRPGASISEVKPYLKDIKGIKINDPVVTVEFK
ncbi:MAG: hypothetical protein LC791_03605 [Acidobacteria bacterium]|nr:hypothetical protein [Acidobacteriota bacterium]